MDCFLHFKKLKFFFSFQIPCKNFKENFLFQVVLQPDTVYERIQFQFEDEAYDTVSDLITYYVGSGKVISALSGARIQIPKNRFHPLSFYASKYAANQQGSSGSPLSSPFLGPANSKYNSFNTINQSPLRQKRDAPPRLPSKQRSLSLTPAELNGKLQMLHCGNEKSNSADGVIRESKANCGRFTTNSLPRGNGKGTAIANDNEAASRGGKMSRVTSDPALSPCFERRSTGRSSNEDVDLEIRSPPPKPSRIPSLQGGPEIDHRSKEIGFSRATSYQASGSDSGNGSGDSVQSSAAGDSNEATTPCSTGIVSRGVVIKNPRFRYGESAVPASASSTTLKAMEYDPFAENFLVDSLPEAKINSAFDLENFQTLLLPSLENKPVDHSALQCVKNMLRENGSRILANHMTRVDLEITVREKTSAESWQELGFGISSGIEMCTLPQGQQTRIDIIER